MTTAEHHGQPETGSTGEAVSDNKSKAPSNQQPKDGSTNIQSALES